MEEQWINFLELKFDDLVVLSVLGHNAFENNFSEFDAAKIQHW